MSDKIINPLTGRPILVGGPTFKKLVKEGLINSKGEPINKKSSTKKSSTKKSSTKKSSTKKSSTKKSSTKKSSTMVKPSKNSIEKILEKMQKNRTEITLSIPSKKYVKLMKKYENELKEIQEKNYNKTMITYLPDENGEVRTSWAYSIIMKRENVKKIVITLRYKEYVKVLLEEILVKMKKSKKDRDTFSMLHEDYVILEKDYKKELEKIKKKKYIDVEIYEKDSYTNEIHSFYKEDSWKMESIINSSFMNGHPVQKVEISLRDKDEYILQQEKEERKEERKKAKKQKKSEDYLSLVKLDGLKLKDIPKKYRDETVCLTAVKQNGLALEFVPKKLRYTRDVYRAYNKKERISFAAVKQNGLALEFVPSDDEQYKVIALLAIEQNPMSVEFLKPINNPFLAPEIADSDTYILYFEAVFREPKAIKFVPEKWKNKILGDIERVKKNQENFYEEFKEFFGDKFSAKQELTPEIKKKYKFLALHLHPDKNPDAGTVFKEINSIYQKGKYSVIEEIYDEYQKSKDIEKIKKIIKNNK